MLEGVELHSLLRIVSHLVDLEQYSIETPQFATQLLILSFGAAAMIEGCDDVFDKDAH